jgi:hypothetical protein
MKISNFFRTVVTNSKVEGGYFTPQKLLDKTNSYFVVLVEGDEALYTPLHENYYYLITIPQNMQQTSLFLYVLHGLSKVLYVIAYIEYTYIKCPDIYSVYSELTLFTFT